MGWTRDVASEKDWTMDSGQRTPGETRRDGGRVTHGHGHGHWTVVRPDRLRAVLDYARRLRRPQLRWSLRTWRAVGAKKTQLGHFVFRSCSSTALLSELDGDQAPENRTDRPAAATPSQGPAAPTGLA